VSAIDESLAASGSLIVFSNVLATQIGLPIPSVPTLIAAGALAAHGRLSFAMVIGASTLACFLADSFWFALGRTFGSRGLTLVCRLSLSPYACVGRARELMSHWGARLMLVAKFVPGAGQMTAPTLGATGLSYTRFVPLDIVGSVFWTALFVTAGAFFREGVDMALEKAAAMGYWLALVGSVMIAALIIQRIVRGRMLLAELGRQRVSVQTVHQRMQSPEPMMVFDVRTIDSRRADNRRIPGAKLIEVPAPRGELAQYPHDMEVYVYCTCPNDASAAGVARYLRDNGFTEVYPIAGGWSAWLKAGYPTEAVPETSPGVPSAT
jgi:membrane protein DedA with SNARE-associated domain/rhodanese-related sulfurtransferase